MRIITVLLFFFSTSLLAGNDISDDIASAVRTGNSKELSKYFTDNIELKILDVEEIYSKAQAELIIKEFFSKHPVKSYTVAHKSAAKNESLFAIGTLETTNGKFRIYFLLKKTADKSLIQQFRIETENE